MKQKSFLESCHDYSGSFNCFGRIHKPLRVTPTMAAGFTDKLCEIGEVVEVLEISEAEQKAA